MDLLSVFSIALILALLAWYGLGKLVSKNLFARWFFQTKIVRGYENEQLEKFKNQRFILSGFDKAPEFRQKIYKILKLCGAAVIFGESDRTLSYPLWELYLVKKEKDDYHLKLRYRGPQIINYNLTIFRLSDPFSFLINHIAPCLTKP